MTTVNAIPATINSTQSHLTTLSKKVEETCKNTDVEISKQGDNPFVTYKNNKGDCKECEEAKKEFNIYKTIMEFNKANGIKLSDEK